MSRPSACFPYHPSGAYVLMLYALLGVAAGVGAAGFIRGLHFAEEKFERIKNPYCPPRAGNGLVGAMMYAFLRLSGHYEIQGVGYATIQDVLLGVVGAAPFLGLLFPAKLVATSLSLGSGSQAEFSRRRCSWAPRWGAHSARWCNFFFPPWASACPHLRWSEWPQWLAALPALP